VEQPKLFRTLAEYSLNRRLRNLLGSENVATERVESLLEEAREMQVPLDTSTLEFVMRRQTEERARAFWANPGELAALQRLEESVQLARSLPFAVNLWQVQNLCAEKLDGTFGAIQKDAQQGDQDAKLWIEHMSSLAKSLDLKVE
jgi:hypothetical protein